MANKNVLRMGLSGREIDIHIVATSEEQAQKMYEAIERSLVKSVRIDMENEWERNNGSDRHE